MSSTKSLIIAGIAVIIAAGIIISIMDSDNSIAIEDKPDTTSQQKKTLNWNNLHENVQTTFTEAVVLPEIESKAFIHPFAVVIGDCHISKMVFVAPTAVCRGDEGTPIYVGENSNLQDGVVLHALKTTNDGSNIDGMKFSSDGERLNGDDSRFESGYAIWIGERVSLAHGSQVHGPAWVGDDTFIGMEALIFNAKLGNNVSIGVAATVTDGVEIADNKFVPPGRVIVTQAEADALPDRIGSGAYETINQGVVDVNMQLTEGFNQIDIEKLILERERLMEERMLETAQPAP
jgi:carbon dioxide concentrating mechanism protein CcmM